MTIRHSNTGTGRKVPPCLTLMAGIYNGLKPGATSMIVPLPFVESGGNAGKTNITAHYVRRFASENGVEVADFGVCDEDEGATEVAFLLPKGK